MLYASEKQLPKEMTLPLLKQMAEKEEKAVVHGAVHVIREMGDVSFVMLRMAAGLLQCVYDKATSGFDLQEIGEECCVEFEGVLHQEPRAPGGFELRITGVKVLSRPAAPLPYVIHKRNLNVTLETELATRAAALRSGNRRARFRVQEGIVRGFRDYLHTQGFTEIHTPKIVAASAEGGANVFRMDYFGKKAYLAQSPQFYKQTLVAVYERVFEVGPVFRAEKHNTTRHLNEYTGLDFEMGYIHSFTEIMDMEAGMLQYVFNLLQKDYANELRALQIELPSAEKIPTVRFREAKEAIAEAYNRKIKDPFDLEPEEEQLISQYYKEKCGSDFVFVTHYPAKKRPFYAMDDPEDPRYTLSFDLLFRGMEITTGGQRIHDYNEQLEKMKAKNLDPADFESYLQLHKYGVPPHGGLGIGLERLCMKLFGDNNIRLSSMFPRDMNRIAP